MGVNMKQLADGSMGLEGYNLDSGAFVVIAGEYTASSVDKVIAVLPRRMIVQGIVGRVTVAGTDSGSVTAVVRKVSSGTAIASGTALHSGSFNLKGTADTNQTLTLSTTPSDLIVEAGQALAIDFTGTLTSATGVISVFLNPA